MSIYKNYQMIIIITIDGKDPVIKEDKEYPDWVFGLNKKVIINNLFILNTIITTIKLIK